MEAEDTKRPAFDFNENYILEDANVLLRPLTQSDSEHLLCFSEQEPEIWQFNTGGADGADKLECYVKTAVEKRSKQFEYPFIVWDKATHSYAGSTRFYDFQFEKKTIQIGFTWYGKKYQGSGINKSCKTLLLDFAFSHLGMERVGFAANSANLRSINAMKSIGCKMEGILRSNSLDAHGQRIDNVVLSILKSEWEDRLKESAEALSAKEQSPSLSTVIDKTNASFYTWGEDCLSYIITETSFLSVKQELMPHGTKEQLHYHFKSRQVFHIIKGKAAFYVDGESMFLQQGQSIIIAPGQKHFVSNEYGEDLEFLVISQPSTTGDRVNVTQ